jgi:hypothetical protein
MATLAGPGPGGEAIYNMSEVMRVHRLTSRVSRMATKVKTIYESLSSLLIVPIGSPLVFGWWRSHPDIHSQGWEMWRDAPVRGHLEMDEYHKRISISLVAGEGRDAD